VVFRRVDDEWVEDLDSDKYHRGTVLQYSIFSLTRLLYNSAFKLSSPHVGVIPVLFPAPRHVHLNQQRLRDVPI
jgi:hypothetical protein